MIKEFFQKLREYRAHTLLIGGFWCYFSMATTWCVSPDANNYFPESVPYSVWACIPVFYGLFGAFLLHCSYKNLSKSSSRIAYATIAYVIPFLGALTNLILGDELYSFGGLFPGLGALGVYLAALFTLILTIILSLIFLIRYLKLKKRGFIQKPLSKKSVIAQNIFFSLTITAIVVAVSALLLSILFDWTDSISKAHEEKITTAFIQKLWNQHPDKTPDDLEFTTRSVATYLLMMTNYPEIELGSPSEVANLLHVDEKIITDGLAALQSVPKFYEFQEGTSGIKCDITYDAALKTITCHCPLDYIDRNQSCFVYKSLDITFNDALEAIAISIN